MSVKCREVQWYRLKQCVCVDSFCSSVKSMRPYFLRTCRASSLGKLVLFLCLARERLYYLAGVWGNLNLTLSFTRHHVCYKRLEMASRLWEEVQARGWSPALKERLSLMRQQLRKTCRVFRREKREAKRWALIGWQWGWAGLGRAGNRWLRAFSVMGQDLGKNKDF